MHWESELATKIASLDAPGTLALVYYVSAESAGEATRQSWPIRGTVDEFIQQFLDMPEDRKLERLIGYPQVTKQRFSAK
ncbi:hypothetical protein A8H39_01260 [Paraburkholderia fungorum]|nr:hypothetical protein A8H39_01260 [Paraburkholderia fungorum]